MLNKIKAFIKKETVFFISAVLAVASMLLVPPDAEYIEYIDFRVLGLLFCLMAVVAGLKLSGVFGSLTFQLLSRIKNGRILSLTLIALPFFSSMLITNDVALIVFVPFTITLLSDSGYKKSIINIIVMQTVAANLGSMATSVGNPQNLFIYSAYDLSLGEFSSVTLPLTAVSLAALILSSLWLLPKKLSFCEITEEKINNKKHLVVYALLFLLALFTVFRVVPYQITTIVTAIAILIINKKLLKEIDFMLLLTFVCFFIISENLGRLDIVRTLLQHLLEKSTLITALATSQVISNVPAAVLLSGFTQNWQDLLAGVNIGGLGTPIASLASLITLKFYIKVPDSKVMRFISIFTIVNIIGIIILLTFKLIK